MKRWFYLIVALQILFLLAEAAVNQIALSRGPVITLKCVPVDPRSLFLGNYMDLSYDISSIDLSKIEHDAPAEAFRHNRTVYVGLLPQKPWAVARKLTISPPPPDKEIVYLRGRVTYRSFGHEPGERVPLEIGVYYDLERYFIPEKKQKEVEQLQFGQLRRGGRPHEITVEVAIGWKGQGLIRRVLVDGKPLKF